MPPKPEFVDRRSFTLPRLIYSGDMLDPHEIHEAAPMGWSVAFVYHVFDTAGEVLYVGFTETPLNRWQAHRRKANWWDSATMLNLYQVDGRDRNTAQNGARRWESRAIHGALPRFNRLGPASLPSKAAAK
jgi:hypothetical protein